MAGWMACRGTVHVAKEKLVTNNVFCEHIDLGGQAVNCCNDHDTVMAATKSWLMDTENHKVNILN